MPLSLSESQVIGEITNLLYSYLPGKPHPYADQKISFLGVTQEVGLENYWSSGSKLPAITTLLESTLNYQRDRFCKLMIEIIRKGLKYRQKKGEDVTREEIEILNSLIKKLNFKIPELWDSSFLDSLPRAPSLGRTYPNFSKYKNSITSKWSLRIHFFCSLVRNQKLDEIIKIFDGIRLGEKYEYFKRNRQMEVRS